MREGWNEVEARLGLWVRGQLILMASILLLTTVAYFVLGLPNALLLGLIAGIAEVIPIVGPALVPCPHCSWPPSADSPDRAAGGRGLCRDPGPGGELLVPMVMRSTIGVPPSWW